MGESNSCSSCQVINHINYYILNILLQKLNCICRCISTTCSVRQGAVVCSYSEEDNLTRQRGWSRSRTLSVSYAGAGEIQLYNKNVLKY